MTGPKVSKQRFFNLYFLKPCPGDIWLVFRHVLLWVFYSCVDRTELNKKVFIIILSFYNNITHHTTPPHHTTPHTRKVLNTLTLWNRMADSQGFFQAVYRHYTLRKIYKYHSWPLTCWWKVESILLYFSSDSGLILQVPQHNYGKVMFRWDQHLSGYFFIKKRKFQLNIVVLILCVLLCLSVGK